MKNDIVCLQKSIEQSNNIVFLGGAGVSTESGIPDFRSSGGLYNKENSYKPETILSSSFFSSYTLEFFTFYKKHMVFLDAQPSAAHKKLAELETAGKLKALITQNIDGLHQKAGSKKVLELHGSVYRNTCLKCSKQYGISYIMQSDGIPICSCGGIVKPDVVLYEEPLNMAVFDEAIRFISQSDLLIVGGTSLAVYPAAGLVNYCAGELVLINKQQTPYDTKANNVFRQSIGEVLGALKI